MAHFSWYQICSWSSHLSALNSSRGETGVPSKWDWFHRFAFLCATLSDLGISVYKFFFLLMLKMSGLWRFSSILPWNHLVLMPLIGFPLMTISISFKELGKYKLSVSTGVKFIKLYLPRKSFLSLIYRHRFVQDLDLYKICTRS